MDLDHAMKFHEVSKGAVAAASKTERPSPTADLTEGSAQGLAADSSDACVLSKKPKFSTPPATTIS